MINISWQRSTLRDLVHKTLNDSEDSTLIISAYISSEWARQPLREATAKALGRDVEKRDKHPIIQYAAEESLGTITFSLNSVMSFQVSVEGPTRFHVDGTALIDNMSSYNKIKLNFEEVDHGERTEL